uniref:Uncharacterized protein n=1 Tax=Ditylum brightwellii TaxID=49249 RepID=A0A7S4SFI3_9STRA
MATIQPLSLLATNAQHHLDVRDKKISLYVLQEVHRVLKSECAVDESIDLKTDHFEGLRADILAWGQFVDHDIQEISCDKDEGIKFDRYLITKREPTKDAQPEKMAVVISSEGLLDLVSPLGFALAAALAGISVSIFFQGPGVHVLRKDFEGSLPGWKAPFSRFARKGMAKMGHVTPQEKLEQLMQLGAHIYVCHPSMEVFKVAEKDLVRSDITRCEYTRFLMEMRHASVHIYT